MTRKRKGDLAMTVVFTLFITMTVAALLSLVLAQAQTSRRSAEHSGNIDSYVTLTSICADAFLEDVMAQQINVTTTDVLSPFTGNITPEHFEKAASLLQYGKLNIVTEKYEGGLQSKPDENGEWVHDGEWVHTLQNPYDAIATAEIENDEFNAFAAELLTNATVEVKIDRPIQFRNIETSISNTGGTVEVDDFYCNVTLYKGTTKIEQSYLVSGLVATGQKSSAGIMTCNIHKSDYFTCELMAQTVVRNNIEIPAVANS